MQQIADEKSEAKQLKADQDELDAYEQQLVNNIEDDENDNEENE